MAKMGSQKSGKRSAARKNLYSLSRYIRVYNDEEGQPYGVQISGYRYNGDGEDAKREYVNLWISDDFQVRKGKDGNFVLLVKILDVDVREREKKEEDDDNESDDQD